MIEGVAKKALHLLSGNRKMYYRKLSEIAALSVDKKILEIGSGKMVKGEYAYSAAHLFKNAKRFEMTDINPEFGHRVLDITSMKDKSKYDVVLCLNVLEHIYDFQTAVNNLRAALKKGGTLAVAVPFTFPLHDEPSDYWRFTEHALRKMLSEFSEVEITPQRSRRWPTGYFVIAKK